MSQSRGTGSAGGSGKRTIVFHIGLERTGTTSVQRFCLQNRKALLKQSVLYPTKHLGFGEINHIGLASSYMPPEAMDYFVRNLGSKRSRAGLLAEIEASEARTVLLSSEHFSSRFRGLQARALAADFSGFDCRVVIVLRAHLRRFCSLYATHIAGGGRVTIDQFAEGVLAERSWELRYADMIEAWRDAFGAASVESYVFNGRGDALLSFFGPGGPLPLRGDVRSTNHRRRFDLFGGRTNRSLGPRRTAALRNVNKFASRLIGDTPAAMSVRQPIWAAARSALHLGDPFAREDRESGLSRWGLAPHLQRRLVELAEADATRLKERFGVDLAAEPEAPSAPTRP